MKKGLLFGAATAAVTVAMAAGLTWAQTRQDDSKAELSQRKVERAKQYATWKLNDLLDELDADAKQREVLHGLKDQLIDEGVALHPAKQALRDELLTQWKSERPDANAAHAAVDRMFDEVRAFAHKVVDAGLTLHQTLRPEQRTELVERAESRRSRWHP